MRAVDALEADPYDRTEEAPSLASLVEDCLDSEGGWFLLSELRCRLRSSRAWVPPGFRGWLTIRWVWASLLWNCSSCSSWILRVRDLTRDRRVENRFSAVISRNPSSSKSSSPEEKLSLLCIEVDARALRAGLLLLRRELMGSLVDDDGSVDDRPCLPKELYLWSPEKEDRPP